MVDHFRRILNDFKRPYLVRLEQKGSSDKEPIQGTDRLERVLEFIDNLHDIVKGLITGTQLASTEDVQAITRVFEQEKILEAIRTNPSLKTVLLHYLTLDLKTYPFTYTTGHIKQLEKNNVASYQHQIISNLE